MTTLALLSILATVSAAGPNEVEINLGLLDGLREGDVGSAYYVLTVADRQVRIAAGDLRITRCEDESALALRLSDKRIYPGFQVEFQVPALRQNPSELLRMADRRLDQGQLESGLRFLKKAQGLVPGEAVIERRIASVRRQLASASKKDQPNGNEAPGQSQPDTPLLPAVDVAAVTVPQGTYQIGLPKRQARFHNQYPRFELQLESFRIDRRPASVGEYQRITGKAPGSRIGEISTGLSFQDAWDYCQALGKRLPTEFEWEVAVEHHRMEVPLGTADWTESWYLPYPGNDSPEREFGKRFRVLRGYDNRGVLDPKLRFFMAPGERAPDVSVRCVDK